MTNPLLDELQHTEAVPSATVSLPTRGYFYDLEKVFKQGTNVDDLMIKIVSPLDYQNYTDPFLLASGEGIKNLIKHIAPEILQPEELSDIDVTTILIASRLISYGPELKFTHVCNNQNNDGKSCQHKNTLIVDLHDFISRYAPFEPNDIEKYKVIIEIGSIKQIVHLRPISYKQSINVLKKSFITQRKMDSLTNVSVDDFIINDNMIQNYIEVLNETTDTNIQQIVDSIFYIETSKSHKVFDQEMIKEWLLAVNGTINNLVIKRIAELGAVEIERTMLKYQCESCGFENKVQVQLDPQKLFFIEPEDLQMANKSSEVSNKPKKNVRTRSKTLPV